MSATSYLLGRQTFDGLGRQRKVEVAGRATQHHYQPGQRPPAASTLADGKRVIFSYEPQLGNALLSTETADQAPEHLSYHPTLGTPTRATGALGSHQWRFAPSGQRLHDEWLIDGQTHRTQWRHSLNGLLLGFFAADGVERQHRYDAFGRISEIQVGSVKTTVTYDAFARPATLTTHDADTNHELVRQLTYDLMGREASSVFLVNANDGGSSFTQTLDYSPFDQLTRRTWNNGKHLGVEHFAYDPRGRLVRYHANAHAAPLDPFGNAILEQRFTLNALDGHEQIISHFSDGSQDVARYGYAKGDPTQVVSITHTHPSWPALIELTYDACGRVIGDSLGRTLTWNAQDRLRRVEYRGRTCEYRYTPDGQLCDRVMDGVLQRSFFSAGQVTHEQQGDADLRLIGADGQVFAVSRLAEGLRQTTLLGCDSQGSVRLEVSESTHERRYTAHGATPETEGDSPVGYAGERREPWTGWYIPAGYRPYDPLLMLFLAPDTASPFDRGGINAYAYCGGDPVNRTDPDGHSWVTWAVAGAGLALGAAATLASFGTAAPAIATLFYAGLGALTPQLALAIGCAALNAASLGSGAAAMVLQASHSHEQTASALGWVSLGTGIASAGLTMGPLASRLIANLGRSSGRAATKISRYSICSQPARQVKESDVLFAMHRDTADVVFHRNYLKQGLVAMETHGRHTGELLSSRGRLVGAEQFAASDIAPRLDAIGYPAGKPIVLLACEGGNSGAAQQIANVLQRPVQGFHGQLGLSSTLEMNRNLRLDMSSALGTNIPTTPVPIPRIGPFKDLPSHTIAASSMYHPHKGTRWL